MQDRVTEFGTYIFEVFGIGVRSVGVEEVDKRSPAAAWWGQWVVMSVVTAS